MKRAAAYILTLILAVGLIAGYAVNRYGREAVFGFLYSPVTDTDGAEEDGAEAGFASGELLEAIPEWSGLPFTYVNGNVPFFGKDEIRSTVQESLAPLDKLGRCTQASACVGRECMPEGERGSIKSIKPSGWHTVRYDFIEGGYVFNRCHLIGYQLTGDDAIERNLITGTRYMNKDGMLPFENAVASYVRLTGRHVMYRVTPVYKGSEAVARGVLMEALSVEDNGKGISFNVFCYNCQPGVEIDYRTGENRRAAGEEDLRLLEKYSKGRLSAFPRKNGRVSEKEMEALLLNRSKAASYYINSFSGKIHLKGCEKLAESKPSHIHREKTSIEELLYRGYVPCSVCQP